MGSLETRAGDQLLRLRREFLYKYLKRRRAEWNAQRLVGRTSALNLMGAASVRIAAENARIQIAQIV
jgi:hypothetical protein